MTNIYEAVSSEVEIAQSKWTNLKTQFDVALDADGDSVLKGELVQIDADVAVGLRELNEVLKHPELVLAVVGTAKAGKSTFFNFLAGSKILPSSVEVKTGGVTIIKNSPEKRLQINGEEKPVENDAAILAAINAVMTDYQESRRKESLPPPQVELDYPLSVVSMDAPDGLAVPDFASVRFFDLPGLEGMQDDTNGTIIKEQCRNALSCLIYNAEESDEQKKKKLLTEVVGQIKEMGCSPARVVFIFNRIDAYRRDDSWTLDYEVKKVNELKSDIQKELKDSFPEYQSAIEDLQVVPFSSEPALLSKQILQEEGWENAAEKVNNFYGYLVKDVLDDLPRRTNNWNLAQRKKISEALFANSHAATLIQFLREHIKRRLPELVIPPSIDLHWRKAGGNARQYALQVAGARLIGAQEDCNQKLESLENVRTDVTRKLKASATQLSEPFQQVLTNEQNFLDKFKRTFASLAQRDPWTRFGNPNEFAALWEWAKRPTGDLAEILFAVEALLACEAEAEERVRDIPHLNSKTKDTIVKLCKRLNDRGYKGQGWNFEARDDYDRERLRSINEGLTDLSESLAKGCSRGINHILEREKVQLEHFILRMTEFYRNATDESIKKIAGNYHIALNLPRFSFSEQKFDAKFSFSGGFPINKGTEQISKEVRRNPKDFWETIESWFGKEHKETIFEHRQLDQAELPSWDGLTIGWMANAGNEQERIVRNFTKWILDEWARMSSSFRESAVASISQYETRIQEAKVFAENRHEEIKGRWEPILEESEQWGRIAEGIGGGLSEELLAGEWVSSSGWILTIKEDNSWTQSKISSTEGMCDNPEPSEGEDRLHHEGGWVFESPILILKENDDLHYWIASAGSYLWDISTPTQKFEKKVNYELQS